MLNSLEFLLSTPAVDTAGAMFITIIYGPLTLGQPPNFDPGSMNSFYDDDGDDVVSGVYHCNSTFVYTKVATSSLLTTHHYMVDLFTHFSRPQPPSPLALFLFCQFVLVFLSHIWMKSYNICFSPYDLYSPSLSRSIRAVANSRISFSSRLTNIPVCVCVCVSHVFLIHLSINKYLGCFDTLVTINNAAMNTGL